MRIMIVILINLALHSNVSAETISLEKDAWQINGDSHQFDVIDNEKVMFIENGRALLRGKQLENGIIEFDVKFPEQRGFVGVRFRRQDQSNFEDFYIRTHQSGNPDANQYSPTFNGLPGWQIYYGPRYATPVTYEHDKWTHVKLVISDDAADVFIDSVEPVLHVSDLKHEQSTGGVELWTNNTGAYFKNVIVSPLDNIKTIGTANPEPELQAGIIKNWLVSEAVSPGEFDGDYALDPDQIGELRWMPLKSETNGVANLARVVKGKPEKNMTFAKIVIDADTASMKRMSFGFSDQVRIYLNGRILYQGNDIYGSRDYRFLGTVGLYDSLFLPLAVGRNEIVFAVSETFGGWAVTAAIEDRADIEIIDD